MDAFGDTGDNRRVILLLSDGRDSGARFGKGVVSQIEVIERARDEDVMIYAIGLRSRRSGAIGGDLPSMMTADLPDPGLARVAEETGGGYTEIRPGQDLSAAFAAVVDELHSQYAIGFAPPRRDGKTHKVDVRVTGSGLKVRGRKSYVAPKK